MRTWFAASGRLLFAHIFFVSQTRYSRNAVLYCVCWGVMFSLSASSCQAGTHQQAETLGCSLASTAVREHCYSFRWLSCPWEGWLFSETAELMPLRLELVSQLSSCSAACSVWLGASVRQLLSNYWKVQQERKVFGAELLIVWESARDIRQGKHLRLFRQQIMLPLDYSELFEFGTKCHWAAVMSVSAQLTNSE